MATVADFLIDHRGGNDPATTAFLQNIAKYLKTGDAQGVQSFGGSWGCDAHRFQMGRALGSTAVWSATEHKIADYSLHLLSAYAGTPLEEQAALIFSGIAHGFSDLTPSAAENPHGRQFFSAAETKGVAPLNLSKYAIGRTDWWKSAEANDPVEVTLENETQRFLWRQCDDTLVALIPQTDSEWLLSKAACYRPQVIREWLQNLRSKNQFPQPKAWRNILKGGEIFIPDCLSAFQTTASAVDRWEILQALDGRFGGRFADMIVNELRDHDLAAVPEAMHWLAEHDPCLAISQLTHLIRFGPYHHYHTEPWHHWGYSGAYNEAAKRLANDGRSVFEAALKNGDVRIHFSCMEALSESAPPNQRAQIAGYARIFIEGRTNAELQLLWQEILKVSPPILIDEQWVLLGSKSKLLRSLAVSGLRSALGHEALEGAVTRLEHKKSDVRLGAVALLAALNSDAAVSALRKRLTQETSEAVRAAFHEVLVDRVNSPAAQEIQLGPSLEDLENLISSKPSGKSSALWLKPESLPPLRSKDDGLLSPSALAFILDKQSKHKTIEPAPDVLPWLAHVDRARSGDFALALLNAWLAEGQDAKHRWVLALAGTLGDSRIISTLLPWIPKWCEAARHKLAEYAAQGISLLGSNEALMVLDTLASRYRSKFRNVGAAAAAAFQSAAQARGISPDELGDLVVPSFDFNEDRQRRFEWDGGAALAELTIDLKLEWSDPDSEKSWKTLPASAPDAVKAEVKELGKLLRETGKAQALRLEQALVKQRRWPVTAWQELYEKHPLLRAYATRLVWGVYDAAATFQRAFRRYPNGILADAAGAMEELPEGDARIGLLHPLDLDDAALTAWQAHLARFKVQPPFPQLDRPVERLEPNLHNRRVLSLTEGREISYGTFRSRAEKRGWGRGSVVDAGGISSYYKLFPGAGVEVSLETGGMYVGMDPMETLTLGPARFCTAGSIQRGSYVYDEPTENDPRLLTFGQVPPVVYSETVSDLKAIIAQKESEEA